MRNFKYGHIKAPTSETRDVHLLTIFITADIPDERHASLFRHLSAGVEKPAGVQGSHGSVSIRGDGVANFDHCINKNVMKVAKMLR